MQYLSYVRYAFVGLALCGLFFALVRAALSRRRRFRPMNEAAYKWSLLVAGLAGLLPVTGLIVYCAAEDKSLLSFTVLTILYVVFFVMVVSYANCRILYDADGFTCGSFWGIEHTYAYEEISRLDYNEKGSSYVQVGRSVYRLPRLMVGREEFFITAQKAYRIRTGREIGYRAFPAKGTWVPLILLLAALVLAAVGFYIVYCNREVRYSFISALFAREPLHRLLTGMGS